MNILIWDMDWMANKNAIPNVYAMKISSYHKQLNDIVSFVERKTDVDMKFDLLYILHEDAALKNPPIKFLGKPNVKLIGSFRVGKADKIERIILQCRPDYNLYPKDTAEQNSDFVLLFDDDGVAIDKQQDFKNTFTDKYTIIADRRLWENSAAEIKKRLQAIKGCKNIRFLHAISLKTLVNDEELSNEFFQLKIKPGTPMLLENDIGSNYEDAEKIAAWLQKYKDSKTIKSKIPDIYFDSVSLNHYYKNQNIWKDLERDLRLINLSKKYQVPFRLKNLKTNQTIYVDLFMAIIKWSYTRKSFIEFIAEETSKKYNISTYSILCDNKYWNDDLLHNTLQIIYKHPEWNEYWTREWGDKFFLLEYVNLKQIEENL